MPTALLTTDVDAAVAALLSGRLVGLPTETVYGLAADAENPSAVARVYAAKGRPADHPLIVHVGGADDLAPGARWVREVPAYATALARAFWPGPLTLVLPRGPRAGDHVTGGQDTVAVRAPSHPVARAVLAGLAAARPAPGVAAPSANRFGRVSPTTAEHVVEELGATLAPGQDVVLDGGPSQVGVESTIVDCTGDAPVILRPGAIGADDVEAAGGVPVASRPRSAVRAPGMLASHYAPRARVVLVELADVPLEGSLDGGVALHGSASAPHGPTTGLLAPVQVPTPDGVVRLSAPTDAADYARRLYAALREADALGLRTVLAVAPQAQADAEQGLIAAVRDRLRRAAAEIAHSP